MLATFLTQYNLPNFGRALITGLFYDIPLETDQTQILDDVKGYTPPIPFGMFLISDSYSVGDRCYCSNIIGFEGADTPIPDTPLGANVTAAEICDRLGPGPGSMGRPLYNDAQCGNGPFLGTGDEKSCPGRVDHGPAGCGVVGPKWNFDGVV